MVSFPSFCFFKRRLLLIDIAQQIFNQTQLSYIYLKNPLKWRIFEAENYGTFDSSTAGIFYMSVKNTLDLERKSEEKLKKKHLKITSN